MYLKSIKAQGFKSFADKLDLEINPGITGVVGPNGSGKSNIVDAVRWVLGEQSVKSLRESGMTDCIFSGSESREAQKRAMVALTFDNTDKYLHSDFSEVEIKRVIYNTGENEYYINCSRVRLKDITDLFIDSGAGANAFNIISQGNVTDIVNSKSTERRVIFESAAGVLKYKKRKEESLKKLEKTEENITRIKLIIKELSETVEPLKEQAIVAEKYLNIKGELESIDIALIAKDIENYNLEYSTLKSEIDGIKENLDKIGTSEYDVKLEKLKLKNLELEDKINKKQEELLSVTKNLSDLSSEKQITLEREKYKSDSKTIDNNLLKLKENELEINKNIDVLNEEIKTLENNLNTKKEELSTLDNDILVLKVKQSNSNNNLLNTNKEEFLIKNKIEILENNILSMESVPSSVKNILNNPRLKGIHNTIGNLINANDKYLIALDVALGGSTNYIVVDDDKSALNAIDYLKNNKLGRATFYPLNVIKGRNIPKETINDIKGIKGFIGVLSDLIEYDSLYKDIITNQLGQVIVVEDSKSLNVIGKLINYKYRIVSLDGEIIHVGGSITGGSNKLQGIINEKNNLVKLKEEHSVVLVKLNTLNEEIKVINDSIIEKTTKQEELNKVISSLSLDLENKKSLLDKLILEEKNINSELNGIKDLKDNRLDKHLEKLLELISVAEKNKEIVENEIKDLTNNKNDLFDEITDLERKQKEINSNYNSLSNDLKNKEIQTGKIEVKLDNLLETLNTEYNLTYEAATTNYTLSLEANVARSKVNSLKKELNSLGNVNVGAIDEYKRLSERYTFLENQQEDLENSSNELKDIINQMDEIMVDKFSKSFDAIAKEFSRIFKVMFKGGRGELQLCDKNDLLNTGIDIIAIPPGKKINSPVSLSGGEKALTAICLLFAMLEVKPSPFVILDEAEAALDEVNVDMFGKYLNEEKSHSQFIVITHKKRMMEYADSLYGITMQESGVSKIVSARLENIE